MYQQEKKEVKTFTHKNATNLLDWVLNTQTRDLFVVTINFSSSDIKFLAIKGYDQQDNKVFLTSRNMIIKSGTIDTAIIPDIPSYIKSVKVEVVPSRANSSYIVDWQLDGTGNLYKRFFFICEDLNQKISKNNSY